MSKEKIQIDIDPPIYSTIRDEKFIIERFRCNVCGGRGFNFVSPTRDNRTEPCDYCCGTGKLAAHVSITWEPSGEGERESNKPIKSTETDKVDGNRDIRMLDVGVVAVSVIFGTFALFAVCSGYWQHIASFALCAIMGATAGRELYKLKKTVNDER